MHRIYISDLHLEDPSSPQFQRFEECLNTEARRVDEIYILGDLVEMWIGDDDDSRNAAALIDTLHRASRQCRVRVMHGNRDFLFGDAFAELSGAELLTDPYCTDDGVLLSHGDSLCTDDEAYQQMRTLFRSPQWQADILSKTLDERKAIGQALRAQSKESSANKAANIMDVNPAATETLMRAEGKGILLHGHTHRPGVHRETAGQRIVLGAWERCGWLCRQIDNRFALECFSLARRYGT